MGRAAPAVMVIGASGDRSAERVRLAHVRTRERRQRRKQLTGSCCRPHRARSIPNCGTRVKTDKNIGAHAPSLDMARTLSTDSPVGKPKRSDGIVRRSPGHDGRHEQDREVLARSCLDEITGLDSFVALPERVNTSVGLHQVDPVIEIKTSSGPMTDPRLISRGWVCLTSDGDNVAQWWLWRHVPCWHLAAEIANSGCRLSPRTVRTARCSAGCTCREIPARSRFTQTRDFP